MIMALKHIIIRRIKYSYSKFFKLPDHFYFELRLLKMGRLLRMIDPETGQHPVCCGLCHCSRFGQVFVVVVVVDVTVVVLSSLSPHIS